MPAQLDKKGFETVFEKEVEDDLRLWQLWKVWSAHYGPPPDCDRNQTWLDLECPKGLASIRLNRRAIRLLIRCLRAGHSGSVPKTLASAVHFRELRRQHIGGLLEAFEGYNDADLRVFTVINVKWRVTPQQLARLRASTLVNQFRTHLERAGVNAIPGPLAAYVHSEFDPVSGMIQLHFHGVTTAEKAAALFGLVRKPDGAPRGWGYVRTRTGSAPVRRQRIRDRVRQLSYLLKSYWPSRRIEVGDSGKARRDREPQRIAEPIHSLVLLWLNRESIADLRLLTGCRPRAHGRLKASAPVFERGGALTRDRRSMPQTGRSLPSAASSTRATGRQVDNTAMRRTANS